MKQFCLLALLLITADCMHCNKQVTTEVGGCTEHFSGTSASAPIAAGMIALMLEARCVRYLYMLHAQLAVSLLDLAMYVCMGNYS